MQTVQDYIYTCIERLHMLPGMTMVQKFSTRPSTQHTRGVEIYDLQCYTCRFFLYGYYNLQQFTIIEKIEIIIIKIINWSKKGLDFLSQKYCDCSKPTPGCYKCYNIDERSLWLARISYVQPKQYMHLSREKRLPYPGHLSRPGILHKDATN